MFIGLLALKARGYFLGYKKGLITDRLSCYKTKYDIELQRGLRTLPWKWFKPNCTTRNKKEKRSLDIAGWNVSDCETIYRTQYWQQEKISNRSVVLDRAPLIMCNYLALSLLPQFNLLSCLALLQCINVLVKTSLLQIHFQPRDKNEPPSGGSWISNEVWELFF